MKTVAPGETPNRNSFVPGFVRISTSAVRSARLCTMAALKTLYICHLERILSGKCAWEMKEKGVQGEGNFWKQNHNSFQLFVFEVARRALRGDIELMLPFIAV